MLQFPREKKMALILQSQQAQQQKEQKERMASPDPYAGAQNGGIINRAASARGRFIGSISSRVSFIEPDNSPAKLHSRYSSWSSLAGSYDSGALEDMDTTSQNPAGADRPMSPTMAAAGSLWSSWFGQAPPPDADQEEVADDSPQYYIDQLLSKYVKMLGAA